MSKAKTRLYRFRDKLTGDVTFCRGTTFAQALNYSTRDRYEGRVATPEDMIGVSHKEILDATVPGVHPDQQPLPLDGDDKGGVFGGAAE